MQWVIAAEKMEDGRFNTMAAFNNVYAEGRGGMDPHGLAAQFVRGMKLSHPNRDFEVCYLMGPDAPEFFSLQDFDRELQAQIEECREEMFRRACEEQGWLGKVITTDERGEHTVITKDGRMGIFSDVYYDWETCALKQASLARTHGFKFGPLARCAVLTYDRLTQLEVKEFPMLTHRKNTFVRFLSRTYCIEDMAKPWDELHPHLAAVGWERYHEGRGFVLRLADDNMAHVAQAFQE